MSISCLPSAFACQAASASAKVWPLPWMQKSTWVVVPPNAAAVWPDVTSSIVTVPPKGMSRCVCGSIAPGSTSFPVASITRSASTSSDAPMSAIRSPSTSTSARVESAAVTTRPPLISTDMGPPLAKVVPPRARHRAGGVDGSSLLPARRDLDHRRLVSRADDVDALLLQQDERALGEVRAVGAIRRLLDHLELLGDRGGAVERLGVHDADAARSGPGELVDLVHLPRLM